MTVIVYKLIQKWMKIKYSRSLSYSVKLDFDIWCLRFDGKVARVITESNRNKNEKLEGK